jgi:glycosyltransferase involved in cell wall biosynthesis
LKTRVPGWQLLVIGDGPRRAHLVRRVRELELDAEVRFTGNQVDVPAWLACLDIAVLPSYGDEGVPQSLMQAAACGVPAVSTPVGAIAEAVVDGETGLLVPPRNPRALAQALATLLNARAERERMGRAAHAYAQTHFGIDAMLDAMEAIFDRAAARAR